MLDGVWAFLRQTDLRADGHNVMVYRNNVPKLEFEVGVQVTRTFEPAGRVVPSSLPHGRAAHTIHVGDYARLGEAHDAIARWCRTNRQTASGTRWEVYGDWNEAPDKVQTAVYWLLEI
jgi:effector-binding domain-containing protein